MLHCFAALAVSAPVAVLPVHSGGLGNLNPSASSNDPDKAKFEEEITNKIKTRIQIDLGKYCPEGCAILGIDVQSREIFDTQSATLGFDANSQILRRFSVVRSNVEILIDTKLGKTNIERIEDVLTKVSRRFGVPVELEFTRTTLPDSPDLARAEAEARSRALELIKSELEKILSDFCPQECRLNSIELKTMRVPLEDAQSSMSRRTVVIPDSKTAILINGVTAQLTLDNQMDAERRAQIENLLRENLEIYGQGLLNVKLSPLPKASKELLKDADERRADPWGLEKLGSALRIFREFANTKEIIRERDSLSKETEKDRNRESHSEKSVSSKELNNSRETEQSQIKTDSEKFQSDSAFMNFWSKDKVFLIAVLIAVLLIVSALGLRFVLTGKKVQHLISEGRSGQPASREVASQEQIGADDIAYAREGDASGHAGIAVGASGPGGGRVFVSPRLGINDEVARRMNIQALRDELTQMFIAQPKVARDVFSRVLREDGVEFSAKCVSVLGEILFFDLMGDDDIKKEVALLAEYIHVNAPIVSDSEQLSVLQSLKLKMTAGKMRQMTQRTRETFDFLKSYSARQIYDLVADESPRSQAVVLTQLQTDKRRALFELFEGDLKSLLLKELCVKEALPREYLFNVAQALKRKLERLGTGDGEMLGGADVLIDLMERGDRESQTEMLFNLDRTNPELARQVRSRLVSVETLGYLSDGLLLEIFLALEPQVVVNFLSGTRDSIRRLILTKAPEEVADDWNESAAQIRGLDGETFRLAEMQILSRIRSFAANGLLNLNDINDVMYPRENTSEVNPRAKEGARTFRISSPIVA